MEKLEQFIKENYKAKDGAKTELWSEGNSTWLNIRRSG